MVTFRYNRDLEPILNSIDRVDAITFARPGHPTEYLEEGMQFAHQARAAFVDVGPNKRIPVTSASNLFQLCGLVHVVSQNHLGWNLHWRQTWDICSSIFQVPYGCVRNPINRLTGADLFSLMEQGRAYCPDSLLRVHHLLAGVILYMRGSILVETSDDDNEDLPPVEEERNPVLEFIRGEIFVLLRSGRYIISPGVN